MSKKSCFRKAFDSKHVKESQKLPIFAQQYFYLIVSSVWDKLSCKKSLLVLSPNLGLFVNTWTASDKYCPHNREN